jgi:phosphoribosylaminoimidazole carboxylase PurE protein
MTIRVAILMGSNSDLELMRPAKNMLTELGIDSELRVLSAHRTPEQTAELARGARKRGIKAIICGAGAAAHLAGAVAAQTLLPVIGVPLARTPLAGQDALLATVQMPKGMPVATVAVDGAANAAILAAQIIGNEDAAVLAKLEAMREAGRQKVLAADASLRS